METLILNDRQIDTMLSEIAKKILSCHTDTKNLVIIGIKKRGIDLARRIEKKFSEIKNLSLPVGALDITLYRDDFKELFSQPKLKKTEISFSIENKEVILVDDVLFTGRTVRAALDGIIDLGRPRLIRLAVLIDRGYRELPLQADFVGMKLSTALNQIVVVSLVEEDGKDEVILKDL
ncbi:MAG: bifunctional pyr operon transcriptional regulator/uracil phosphoribosyltransferase PyrR [Thermodesulfobacteriota bacterium]|nr:bifunctional pyr operon transcriptional regulator/uracil phosphoribosyltransferase PyrR [Thermodesulfobacteriota bacterium]